MGRNRTPTPLLELRGAFKNHPSRRREREGEIKPTTPLPGPPAWFSKSQKAVWAEVQALGYWLTSPDRFMCEVAVTLLDRHIRGVSDYKEIPHLISILAKLGLTPVDRAKLKAPEKAIESEFDCL